MDEWKQTVAANLSALRKERHLTQLQLAEILHYSDKAVSKWERGESLPDLAVMKQLADLYEISLDDFLLTPEEREAKAALQQDEESRYTPETADTEPQHRIRKHNRLIIAGMAALLVWLIATLIFVILDAAVPELRYGPFLVLYAAPITAVVWLVFNSIWFHRRWNYVIISLLVWAILGSVFLTFFRIRPQIWKLFLIGVPAQLIIILWSRLRPVNSSAPRKQESPSSSKSRQETAGFFRIYGEFRLSCLFGGCLIALSQMLLLILVRAARRLSDRFY